MGKGSGGDDSAVETVVDNVKDLILRDKLPPGSKLPTEAQLMKRFGVSRSSVREGMKILKTIGLIKVLQGDGTYVAEPDNTALFQTLLMSFSLLKPNINEVIELRELLELITCKLVMTKASNEDISTLHSQVDYYEKCVKSGMFSSEETGDMDIQFHLLLGKMTRNGLIFTLYRFIMDYFRKAVQKSHEIDTSSIERHRKIIIAIESNNLKKLEEAIIGMGEEWRENLEKYSKSKGIDPTNLLGS